MKVKFSWTIPNILTTIRLCAIPIMAWFIYQSGKSESESYGMIAFVFFLAIWITDVVDGFVARKFDMVSDFGKIYDPFVDKLFQFTTALMLLIIRRIPAWVVVFMLTKEVIMILVGAYLLQQKNLVVHSKWYGKASTVLFVIALAFQFFIPAGKKWMSSYIFIAPVAMAVFSLFAYGKSVFIDGDQFPDDAEDVDGVK